MSCVSAFLGNKALSEKMTAKNFKMKGFKVFSVPFILNFNLFELHSTFLLKACLHIPGR